MFDQGTPTQLPIIQSIRASYEFLWTNRHDFMRMCALPALILGFADVIAIALFPPVDGKITYQALAVMVAPALFLYVMFSVAWHRRFLRPSENSTIWEALRWDARKTVFFLRLVAIFVCVAVISLSPTIILTIVGGLLSIVSGAAGASAAIPQGISIFATGIVMTIALVLYARLSLWLPATAVDEKHTILSVWTLGRGNAWTLLGITLGAALPLMFFAILVTSSVQSMAHGLGIDSNLTGRFISALTAGFTNYLTLAAEITALSIAYQKLSRPADPGMPVFRTD
jgi:hypothetical protein